MRRNTVYICVPPKTLAGYKQNATPHPNPELKVRTLNCCWVAFCMKPNRCPLAQDVKNWVLQCIMKNRIQQSENCNHPHVCPNNTQLRDATNSTADSHIQKPHSGA